VGSLATVVIVLAAGVDRLNDGGVGETAVQIARAKAALPVAEALARGILCNALVCLAIWLAMGGRSVSDKILAILFPITGFVVMGFEHSIANWFLLPYGLALDTAGSFTVAHAARNLITVTAGNLLGGTLLVAGVYWIAYLRGERREGGNP
jgi:formate/nitrite transporter